jgi:hypothetical protein
MRYWSVIVVALLAVSIATALLPTAPSTPDPNGIPNASGGGGGSGNASNYQITVLAPPTTVPAPIVRVAYRHNASSVRTCIVTLDNFDWDVDDPRWDNPLFTKQATVSPNTIRNETFTNVLAGSHTLGFFCMMADGNGWQEAFREVTVTGGTTNMSGNATINILSPKSSTGTKVNITFKHNATSSGACTVEVDDEEILTVMVAVNRTSTTMETVSLGSHELVVMCEGIGWSARSVKTFRARAGTNTTTDDALLRLQGGGSAVPAMTAFTLLGTKFPAYDIVELVIRSGGVSDTGEIETDATGAFTIDHDGLPAGTHSITARSATDTSYVAFLLLTVRNGTMTTPAYPPYDPPDSDPWPLEPEDDPDPWPSEPDDTPYVYPDPTLPVTESPAGINLWVWLLPLLLILLLVGGTAGYLAREGMLDVTSWSGFTRSVDDLVHGRSRTSGVTATRPVVTQPRMAVVARPPTAAERTTLRAFIAKERQGGAEDLAIRGALLAKGWEKSLVDGVFDEVYREQRVPKGK